VQGGQIAIATPGDIIKLLQEHPKMQQLRQETGNAYIQRETCSAELVKLAVAAATNPTAGQAMLQRGSRGLAVGGSRSHVVVPNICQKKQWALVDDAQVLSFRAVSGA